jgi:Peptidase propeptide and YPEB domain
MKIKSLALGVGFAVAAMGPAWADRDPTTEEQARIEEALISLGFHDWGSIELDDEAWEVEGAEAANGEGYDLKLDPTTLQVIEQEED